MVKLSVLLASTLGVGYVKSHYYHGDEADACFAIGTDQDACRADKNCYWAGRHPEGARCEFRDNVCTGRSYKFCKNRHSKCEWEDGECHQIEGRRWDCIETEDRHVCYSKVKTKRNWRGAKERCEKIPNGRLARVVNSQENEFLQGILGAPNDHITHESFWMGCRGDPNHLEWDTMDMMEWCTDEDSFQNWNGNVNEEIARPGKDCMEFEHESGLWHINRCRTKTRSICEYEVVDECTVLSNTDADYLFDAATEGVVGDFAVVIDVTGSMEDEINAIKAGVIGVAASGMIGEGEGASYRQASVCLYGDPSGCEMGTSSDMDLFMAMVDDTALCYPCGSSAAKECGGDCPEAMFTGLEACLARVGPNSVVYVVTDADSSDSYKAAELTSLAQSLNTNVYFVLTRTCSGSGDPFHPSVDASYTNIAANTGGEVYHINKLNIASELSTIIESASIAADFPYSISFDAFAAGTNAITTEGFNHMTSIALTVAGNSPGVTCYKQSNGEAISVDDIEVIMSLSTNLAISVPRVGRTSGEMLWDTYLECYTSAGGDYSVSVRSGFVGCAMEGICGGYSVCTDHFECGVFTCESTCPEYIDADSDYAFPATGRAIPVKGDLGIIMDVSGSMSDEIETTKSAIEAVAGSGMVGPAGAFRSAAYCVYSDPSSCLMAHTDNMAHFSDIVGTTTLCDVCGAYECGGDCPESAFSGIMDCFDVMSDNSVVLLITDAGSNDAHLVPELMDRAQSVNTNMYFVLTRTCDGEAEPFHPYADVAYEALSDATGGEVYHINKDNIGYELNEIIQSASIGVDYPHVCGHYHYEDGAAQTITTAGYNHMTSIVFACKGLNVQMSCTDLNGNTIDESDLNVRLDLSTNKVAAVPRIGVTSGNRLWYSELTCTFTADSEFTVSVRSGFVGCSMGDLCNAGEVCIDRTECGVFSCVNMMDECEALADVDSDYHFRGDRASLQGDLAIIMDVSGSMSDEIATTKASISSIATGGMVGPSGAFRNAAYCVYSDPSSCLMSMTDDMTAFSSIVDTTNLCNVCGANECGGDCPESAFTGLQTCLDAVGPNSVLMLITDAGSDDGYMQAAVTEQCQNSNTNIYFVLTRTCSGEGAPFHPSVDSAYTAAADQTGGEVYHINKANIASELAAIVEGASMAVTFPDAIGVSDFVAGSNDLTTVGYNHMTSISYQVKGANPQIACTDMRGDPIDERDMDVLLSISTNVAVSIPRVGSFSGLVLWTDSLTCTTAATTDYVVSVRSGYVGCEMAGICGAARCVENYDCGHFSCH